MLTSHRIPLPPMDRKLLRGFERVSVPALEFIAQRQGLRTAIHALVGNVNAKGIELLTSPTWEIHDFEPIAQLDAPHGIIMLSNHRSFFDMFVISTVIQRRTHLLQRVSYPVRSEFFYTHPLGVVLNVAISGASMWPPVFRDERRRRLNPIGLDQLAATLQRGMGIGLHPEGKRNKGKDPYQFLPLKPGLGQLLTRVHPDTVVLPAFIAGLSNDVATEVVRNRKPPGQRGEPVRIRYGKPIAAGHLQALGEDPMVLTEAAFAPVRALAEIDREDRASHPRML
jgi:1-acyl-sn-glycerol-3-phosphate acyltransferase